MSDIDEAFEVGLNRAVTLIAEKLAGGPRGGRGSAQPLKELGAHPTTGEAMVVMPGRYGAYIKCGSVNATLPKGATPETITAEEAAKLVDDRIASGGGGKAKGRRGAPAKSVAKKPAAKKAAPKKAAKAKA